MDTSKKKQPSIIIGNCLNCRGLVRIPATAAADSTVRCPHCEESFSLEQILEDLVPELELVSDATHDDDLTSIPVVDRVVAKNRGPHEKFVVPVQLSKGAERPSRRRHRTGESSDHSEKNRRDEEASTDLETERLRRENASEFILRKATEGRSKSSSRDKPRHRRSHSSGESGSRRRKKKTKDPFSRPGTTTEFIKILIGGLLAFPIAYLMVFWIFKQDPLSLAPSLGKVVPFIVPAELRASEDEAIVPELPISKAAETR